MLPLSLPAICDIAVVLVAIAPVICCGVAAVGEVDVVAVVIVSYSRTYIHGT